MQGVRYVETDRADRLFHLGVNRGTEYQMYDQLKYCCWYRPGNKTGRSNTRCSRVAHPRTGPRMASLRPNNTLKNRPFFFAYVETRRKVRDQKNAGGYSCCVPHDNTATNRSRRKISSAEAAALHDSACSGRARTLHGRMERERVLIRGPPTPAEPNLNAAVQDTYCSMKQHF